MIRRQLTKIWEMKIALGPVKPEFRALAVVVVDVAIGPNPATNRSRIVSCARFLFHRCSFILATMRKSENRNSTQGDQQAPNPKELRTPRAPEDASRGLTTDFKVFTPNQTTNHDEFVRKFGPLTIETRQALTAIIMLESTETHIVIESLNALQKFCKRLDENKEYYVELGGLVPIAKRMNDTNLIIQRMCMKILALVSTVHKTKLFLRDNDYAKDIIDLCKSTDDITVEYTTRVLSNLCCLHTGRIQICQNPTALPILINLLSHADPDIQRNALETIWQISSDPLHVAQFVETKYLAAILGLVDSDYPPLQALALMTIERIAQRNEGISALESLGSTEILARKLTNETMVDLHRYCLRIIFHECRDRSACRKFAFLAPAIVDVVERTPDPVARVNGLDLLGRLCSLELVAHTLSQSGMPFLLLTMFTHPEAEESLKEACAFMIAQISRSAFGAKREFVQCIPHLFGMIKAKDPIANRRGVERALIALSFIMEDIVSAFREFQQAKGFDVIQKVIQSSESYSDNAILSSLNVLDIIAGNPALRRTVADAHFMPILLTLMNKDIAHSDTSRGMKSEGKIALESDTLGANNPIDDSSKRKTLLDAQPETEQDQLTTNEGGPLDDEEEDEDSPETVTNIIRRTIGPNTASGLNPQILTATCSIICSLLCEPGTHEEFIQQKGPEVLMNMMGHNEFPVIVGAVSIINVACVNSALGKELLDKGLLQVMWKRSDLISKNGPVRAAFDRLIASNLSLKYSIIGHLSPFERIQHPFFDMGGLKRLEDLRFPQDFTWDDRKDMNKKIYFLNMADVDLDGQLLEQNPSLKTMQIKKEDLNSLIYEIESQKEGMTSEPALVNMIGKAVSDRFGGPLDKWRLTAKVEDTEVETIQNQHKSVIIPVTYLTTGTFRVRALVFKALCDMFGIPCSLETSDYRKTWNVVLLRPDERFPRMCPCLEEIEKHGENFVYTDSLRRYVVDLVFQPGALLPLGSFDAETYMSATL